ncbi:MAG: hypothetical protein J6E42_07625 [Firmicutes bacterium]|nr:hypothetical protein [Bacillota bacterium]
MNSSKPTVLIQGGTIIDPSQNLHTKASLLCEGASVSQIIHESDGPALAQARLPWITAIWYGKIWAAPCGSDKAETA